MEEITNEVVQEPAAKNNKGGKRLAAKSGKRPPVIAIVLAVLAAAYLGLCAYASGLDTLFPGMRVEFTPVGGMTVSDAEAQLSSQRPLPADRTATLYLTEAEDPQMLVCDPFKISCADLGGVETDAARSAQRAYDYCHGGSFFQTGWRYLKCRLNQGGVWGVYTAPRLSALAEELAGKWSQPAVDTSYELAEDSISVTVAQDGFRIDPAVLTEMFQNQLAERGFSNFMECPTIPVTAQPLTAQAIHDSLAAEPRNAGYDAAAGTITPERPGGDFDVTAAQAALDAADPGETVIIPARIILPDVTAEKLKEVLFRDVLGECTTPVSGSAGRISNVKLSAAAFHGLVMNDGEVLSYNQTTGRRTAEKGYQPAPAYLNGATVDEIGGGVCQTSSTLYLACLRADLEIVERHAHRYTPAYIPWGMDATVSWGGPDFRFRNDTGYPIRIETSYAAGNLTIRILGTNLDGSTVKITADTLSKTPWKTICEDAPSPPGTERVKVTPYGGAKVKTWRNVYDKDGKLLSSAFEAESDYKVRDKVVARGPAKPPAIPTDGDILLPEEPPAVLPPIDEPPMGEAVILPPEEPY